VRGQYDRALAAGGTLRQSLAEAPVLAEITFEQPGGNGRTARTVHQQIKVVRVTLKAPFYEASVVNTPRSASYIGL